MLCITQCGSTVYKRRDGPSIVCVLKEIPIITGVLDL